MVHLLAVRAGPLWLVNQSVHLNVILAPARIGAVIAGAIKGVVRQVISSFRTLSTGGPPLEKP
jgi:hypothetical protein